MAVGTRELALTAVLLWALVNLVGAALVVGDKRRAGTPRRRTPERRLLWWAAMGGWPLMAVAMRQVRHKTRKRPFKRRFWALALLWCVAVLLLAWQWGLVTLPLQ